MAMLVEAYGSEGAIALSKEFPLQFLDSLLLQTIELRRDPEERVEEEREAAIEEWRDRNQGKTINFTSPTGEVRSFTVGNFSNLLGVNNGYTFRDSDSDDPDDSSG